MINSRQKMLLHIYKNAAELSDPDYREILKTNASVRTAADKGMTQSGFEKAMAALETRLFVRVRAGDVPDPLETNRWIRQEIYWRKKIPATGMINSRQAHKIEELWTRLKEYLPEEKRTINYLGGILHHATGRTRVGFLALKNIEAKYLVDALRDRLAHAIAQPKQEEEFTLF